MNYLLAPWRLGTLALGTGALIAGAQMGIAPDWDIPVSLLMAGSTYLLAPWAVGTIERLEWKKWAMALVAGWWCVDGVYALYWHFANPSALALMRDAQWPCSLALFLICGVLWRRTDRSNT